jgi:hypothetical protein
VQLIPSAACVHSHISIFTAKLQETRVIQKLINAIPTVNILYDNILVNYEKIFRKELDCEIIENKNKTRILPIPVYPHPHHDHVSSSLPPPQAHCTHSHPFMNGLVFSARTELVIYRHGQRFRKMSPSDARGEGNKGYTDGRQLRRRSPPRSWQVARRRGGHVVYV